MNLLTRARTRVPARTNVPFKRLVSAPIAGLVLLVMIGCASGPVIETSDVVVVREDRPEPPSEPGAISAPVIEDDSRVEAPETVFLLARESSYFGDGSLDTSRTIAYGETGTGRTGQTLYSADGNVIETRVYATRDDHTTEERILDERGVVVATWSRTFDPDGRLVDETQRDANGDVQTRSSYTYDEHGRLKEVELYSSFAGPMGSTVFVYDGSLRVRAESLSPGGVLEEYFLYDHDPDGRMVRRTHLTAGGRASGHIVYTYAGELVVRETSFRANGSVLRSAEFEYDDAGNRVVERHSDGAGTVRETVRREFITRKTGE